MASHQHLFALSLPHEHATLKSSAVLRGCCQALRAIDDTATEGFNLERCAQQLGVSSCHLRRLFEQSLGAMPSKIVQTRRMHLAKQLLDETTLSSSDTAFAAGYHTGGGG